MTTTHATDPSSSEPTPVSLHCMEIWGGNNAIDSGVSVPGIDAWVYSRPHAGDRAGGDIHYISTCGSGRITRLAVADVSGHGFIVEDLSASLRTLMRRHINTPDMTRFMRALNEEFGRLAEGGRFATAILATSFAPTDHFIVVNAGHPRPLWYDADAARWRLMDATAEDKADHVANLPLGVIEPTSYEQFAVPLGRNDVVIIYTDALSEARGHDGRMLGEAGLLSLADDVDASDPRGSAAALVEAVERWQGSPLDDDITVMALRHNAGDPKSPGVREAVAVLAKMLGLVKV